MSRVRVGLEVLTADRPELVRGRRVGVLCHHASFTSDLVFAVDALRGAGAVVDRLLGPEHGPWGTAQDMIAVDGGHDPYTDLPLVSLYGSSHDTLRPTADALVGLDALVIDLQDIGARYYTYAATAAMAAEVAHAAGIEAIVCDRPNPLGGAVEGNTVVPELFSFVGQYPAPQRHGLTLAELVGQYVGDVATVMEMEGWRRSMWFDQTGLPWIPPSPNMPTLDTATIYPGLCLIEGATLSEGRGTTTPFELIGAPFIDPFALARELNGRELAGVRFRPHVFLPTFQKHAGATCGGVQIMVTDRQQLRSVQLGIAVLCAIHKLWPDELTWRTEAYEFVTDRLAIDLLLGVPGLREQIEAGEDERAICAHFAVYERQWRQATAAIRRYAD